MAVEEPMTRGAAARVLGVCALVALVAAFTEHIRFRTAFDGAPDHGPYQDLADAIREFGAKN